MNIKKGITIAKALFSETPVNEDWYQKRLSICETCPLNSKNAESVSALQTKTSKYVCKGGPVCTACGCCIELKAGVKTETCGLIEKPELGTPKWGPTLIEPKKSLRFSVEDLNLSGSRLSYGDNGSVVLDVEAEGNAVELKLRISAKGAFEVLSIVAGCTCTAHSIQKEADNKYIVSFTISLLSFKQGVITQKTASVRYLDGRNVKELPFFFKILKK